MKTLDGRMVSKKILEGLRKDIEREKIVPHLVVVSVGENPSSIAYINQKVKAARHAGIHAEWIPLPADTSQQTLSDEIAQHNNNDKVHAILLQLPLPSHLEERRCVSFIRPEKDVDCLSQENIGRLYTGSQLVAPCTPTGIIDLLSFYEIPRAKRHIVIIGRSLIVGRPMAEIALQEDATPLIAHHHTENIRHYTRHADIIISATGSQHLITKDWIRPGSIIIDVGISQSKLNPARLAGDVDWESVKPIAAACSPVPGGVGPMTVAALMKNTWTLAKNQ